MKNVDMFLTIHLCQSSSTLVKGHLKYYQVKHPLSRDVYRNVKENILPNLYNFKHY